MPPDLSELIVHDHRLIAGLLEALQDTERADRFPLAHRLIDELAAHTAAELQILYPALRDIVPGGVALANRGQTDHDTLRPVLVALEQAHPDDAAFDDVVRGVAAAFEGHGPPVENEFLPALRAVIGAPAMLELGAVYASLKDNLPSGLQALPGANPSPTLRRG
jgi:hemerythrin HHE cation binding domain-containing protein